MATNKRLIKSNDEGGGASFNTVLYDGDNTAKTVSVGFEPDLVWIKNRNNSLISTHDHSLFDSVRTTGWRVRSNSTGAENDYSSHMSGFTDSGFNLTTSGALNDGVGNGTYVAWCWKAGGAAVTNTDGTITSQVSANVEAGFSIVSYTGNQTNATVGHGLGVAPKVVIAKGRDYVQNWAVYHYDIGVGKWLLLNGTTTAITENIFGGVHPNSSTFSLNGNVVVNKSGGTNIAYCFAEVPGFSKFGSYVGTGSAGNFQDCGFEPAFVMVKRTDGTSSWYILDNKRDTTNPRDLSLSPDLSNAEGTVPNFINFEPTGFSMASAAGNATGQTWIYMAFANQF